MNEEIEYYLQLVHEQDWEEIEGARDEMTEELAFLLEREYWKLSSWEERAAMVALVQDMQDPGFKLGAMMEDILKIPDIGGDDGAVSIAIAVYYLKRDYKLFDKILGPYNHAKSKASEILGRKI